MSMTKLTKVEHRLINWRNVRAYLNEQLCTIELRLAPASGSPEVVLEDTTIMVSLRLDGDQRVLADSLIVEAVTGCNLKTYFRSTFREVQDGLYYYDLKIQDYEPFLREKPPTTKAKRSSLYQRRA